ncbi:MAG TPA: hypothetical protein VFX59_13505 [Polyangiales bacterium]|nr:hypothetical protein [Polyangiales bacterium]
MLETALESVPLDSPIVSQLLIRHQDGPWNWGGDLRRKWEQHPKVRVLEFPDRVDFAKSYNRTFDAIETPWAMLLPDDDFLVRPAARAAFDAAFAQPAYDQRGLMIFGWYYLRDQLYLHGHLKSHDLAGLMRQTPKFSSVLFNLRRVRELGGFPGDVGGLLDTALIGSLAYRFDALITDTPIGVYRMHAGQESAQKLPPAYVEALRHGLAGYARSEEERERFDELLDAAAGPGSVRALLAQATFALRARTRPAPPPRRFNFRTWI